MRTNFLLFLNIIVILALAGCEDKTSSPQILFEDGIDSISNVFPGDIFVVKGQIIAEEPISNAFYFHQQINPNGSLMETGDRFELGLNGPPNSFSLGFNAEANSIGVKIIAEDSKGNRTVKIFKVIHGEDSLSISFDEPNFIETIESGEIFNVKGKVNSETKITGISYRFVLGELMETPIPIEITDDHETVFDLSLKAKNGMTGILLSATNKGVLTTTKLFRVEHVGSKGPVVLFNVESVKVRSGSTFTVSGTVNSLKELSSVVYQIVKGEQYETAKPITLSGNQFSLELTAEEGMTGVIVSATDVDNFESTVLLPILPIMPERIEGDATVHYKNIYFTDEQFSRSYFSFSMAPYILNKAQADENQDKVDMIFANCFIANEHAQNGPAIFSPNVSKGTTIMAQAWVEGWSHFNLSRLPRTLDFQSTIGKTFDEIEDTNEEWDVIDAYIKNLIANSGVVRGYNMSVGYMFAIGYGGTEVSDINQYAIAVVRGFGGENATSPNESTGAWLEIEIKMRK